MAHCIPELVAAALENTVNDVTVANGYTITLTVQRKRRLDTESVSPANGLAILSLDRMEMDTPVVGSISVVTARMIFRLDVTVLDNDSAAASLETKALDAWADVAKEVGTDLTLASTAFDTEVGLPDITYHGPGHSGFTCTITALTRWKLTNPYTAA